MRFLIAMAAPTKRVVNWLLLARHRRTSGTSGTSGTSVAVDYNIDNINGCPSNYPDCGTTKQGVSAATKPELLRKV
jgi:hypothetical protein